MKITDAGGGLVYDNKLGAPDSDDPTTALGAGTIIVQKGGKPGTVLARDRKPRGGRIQILRRQPTSTPLVRTTPILTPAR
jgi:hypothetical protein